ncbi:MAG: dipeptide/oligopeptide/nickel ABC transporter ATP-binding protein [Paenibacillaceae bacterium ZCTH02-B3]|nr:MAG: dipeptide/oligopeptide/nickel ABC transporter ATP-binding protein [Paenibacillaceae bacterium ZCTH02-B3]
MEKMREVLPPGREILLEAKNVKKYFPIQKGFLRKTVGHVRAVDDVSLTVYRGETLGFVGESGCGKSTLGRVLLMLAPPTEGDVVFEGESLLRLDPEELRRRRKEMRMVFQDPNASLNPRHTVQRIIEEPMLIHGLHSSRKERLEKVVELLESVGLNSSHLHRRPSEFSGGQKQRIAIARALALRPKLIIADEPVSALDVSIQSQILNLMKDLQEEYRLTYVFISHNLSVVKHISDRVGVMYLGRIVELTTKEQLYRNPLHPYTQALISAIPVPDPKPVRQRERIILKGELPSPSNPPKGCRFHSRCPKAMDVCKSVEPRLQEVSPGCLVACHLYGT